MTENTKTNVEQLVLGPLNLKFTPGIKETVEQSQNIQKTREQIEALRFALNRIEVPVTTFTSV